MNELKVFSNPEFGQIRVIQKDNETWFVAKDVCEVLKHSNSRKAVLDMVDEEDVTKGYTPHPQNNEKKMEVIIINESGLYSLVLRSNLPEAKKFKRWITHEVIPSIRKHGAYMTDETIEKALTSPDFLIQLATQLKETKDLNAKQEQLIGELKPRADYTDRILKNKGLVTITQIAKDYGMSGAEMNKKLHNLGVQYKQSDQWLLYRKYQGKGYTHSETIPIEKSFGPDIKMTTKWTQKGRLFLYELLKSEGILPDIEKEEIKN